MRRTREGFVNGVAVVSFVLLVVLTPRWEHHVRLGVLEVAFAVCGALAVATRRTRPYVAVVVMTSALVAGYTLGSAVTPYLFGVGLALYSLAERGPQRAAWFTAAGVGGLVVAALALVPRLLTHDVWETLLWIGLAVTAGDLTRNRRAYLESLVERANRAESARDSEARRRVAEERLQIARDVHDVVGHRIAVMNVQSAVAAQLLETDPDAASRALGHVREAGVTVLEELGGLLTVMRAAEPTPPADFTALSRLTEELSVIGFTTETAVVGRPRPLALGVSQAAFRIVQEALTNGLKYSAGRTAALRVTYGRTTVRVEVRTWLRGDGPGLDVSAPGTAAALGSGGNGIAGMRERARGVGGTLTVRRTKDIFLVTATLPLEPETRGAETGT